MTNDAKLYGAELKMTHDGQTKVFRNWYAQDEMTAQRKMQAAKEIPPPENATVEFTPIESDVIITGLGIYRTDKNERIEFTMVNDVMAFGRILKPDGKPKPKGGRVFYTNGEPSLNEKAGNVIECIQPHRMSALRS